MAKTIIVFMSKGGVGKTSITAAVAYELSKYGKVLLVDADQQGNLTSIYTQDSQIKEKKDYVSYLKEEAELEECLVEIRSETSEYKGIYLLGTQKNDDNVGLWIDGGFRDSPFVIKTLKVDAEELGFDYILFDLPPTLKFYEKIILSTADEIIPIIEPQDFSIDSLSKFHKEMKKVKVGYQAPFSLPNKLIINKIDKSTKSHEYWLSQIKQSPYQIFEINMSKTVPNSTSMKITIQEYDAKNKICATIANLVEEIK